MLQLLAGKDAGEGSVRFRRPRPEETLLYGLIEQYYPEIEMQWAYEGRLLPNYGRSRADSAFWQCAKSEYSLSYQELLVRDAEHSYFSLDNSDEGPMDQLRGHSIHRALSLADQSRSESSSPIEYDL